MYLWEKKDNESAKAYEAFLHYRDLPAGERSLAKVAQELGKSTTLMSRWSTEHGWVTRAAAWDEEKQTGVDDELLAAQKEHRKTVHETSVSLRNRAVAALEALDWEKLTFEQLMLALDTLNKHDRAALGMDGRANGGAGAPNGSTGAPSFSKVYVGVDLGKL